MVKHAGFHCEVVGNLFWKRWVGQCNWLGQGMVVNRRSLLATCCHQCGAFAEMGEKYGSDGVALLRYPHLERISHVHHAGNSSGIVDGAAAVLVGNAAFGKKSGLKPRARIRSFASIGSEPTIMLTGPTPATERALKYARMSAADIDLFELNEAFAAVVLRYMEALSISHDKINVNGGAIAMGHPLGATGAMILGTLLDEMGRRDLGTGLATLCVGAGMGTATIIERV